MVSHFSSGNTHISDQGGALSGARGGAHGLADDPHDPELQELIDAWPGLTDAVKDSILAIVKGDGGMAARAEAEGPA